MAITTIDLEDVKTDDLIFEIGQRFDNSRLAFDEINYLRSIMGLREYEVGSPTIIDIQIDEAMEKLESKYAPQQILQLLESHL